MHWLQAPIEFFDEVRYLQRAMEVQIRKEKQEILKNLQVADLIPLPQTLPPPPLSHTGPSYTPS